MAYFMETISFATTGVKTRTVGFQPIGARITVCAPSNSDTNAQISTGVTNGTLQICDTFYQDATRGKQDRFSDRLVNVYDWNGASIVTMTRANFDSFTATELKFNVITADVNYQYLIEAWS